MKEMKFLSFFCKKKKEIKLVEYTMIPPTPKTFEPVQEVIIPENTNLPSGSVVSKATFGLN